MNPSRVLLPFQRSRRQGRREGGEGGGGGACSTRSTGRAKLTPEERPVPARVKEAVLMPTSRPPESSSGPPLLPLLMAASVCAGHCPRHPLARQ